MDPIVSIGKILIGQPVLATEWITRSSNRLSWISTPVMQVRNGVRMSESALFSKAKLKVDLNETEGKGITRKSCREWVLGWKKNGDLWVCTHFRELNRSVPLGMLPSASPLWCPLLFSLSPWIWPLPCIMFHLMKMFTACATFVGLCEYNRLPQGLCTNPGYFMGLITSIFGVQNYTSLPPLLRWPCFCNIWGASPWQAWEGVQLPTQPRSHTCSKFKLLPYIMAKSCDIVLNVNSHLDLFCGKICIILSYLELGAMVTIELHQKQLWLHHSSFVRILNCWHLAVNQSSLLLFSFDHNWSLLLCC